MTVAPVVPRRPGAGSEMPSTSVNRCPGCCATSAPAQVASAREAARRVERCGPNALRRAGRSTWPRAIARQFTHPLALLLVVAAVLAVVAGTPSLTWAISAVVVLNAVFAFVQEHQAGRAVEALGRYLPPQARVRREGAIQSGPVVDVVPGDVLVLAEGDRAAADARLISGALEIDAAALSGESAPVERAVLCIFAHAVPEVAPFLVFALSGGLVPLPLTVLQILAIDLGTGTLAAPLPSGASPPSPG